VSGGDSSSKNELSAMLRSLQPTLAEGVFAFCRFDHRASIPPSTIGWFREMEGTTIILPLADAGGSEVDFEAAWITLGVESPLSSVGLTAAVSTALANAGIACNIVAANRHDHLFVPVHRAEDAMKVLRRLGEGSEVG